MKDIYESTQEVFDWYKTELSKIAKLVNWYEDHRKILFNSEEFLTNKDTWIPCLFKIPNILRSKWWVNLAKCYWLSEAKRDKIRTFEYFAKKIMEEKQNKISDIREKFWYSIDLKHFE